MKERSEALESIAGIISDYRAGEIPTRTPDVIDSWVQQFPDDKQLPILDALDDVLAKTYISKERSAGFLNVIATTDKLAPSVVPTEYWKRVNLLDIQKAGNSQSEMLDVFDSIMTETHGFDRSGMGVEGGDFVYLDDCVGTGRRVRDDVCDWLAGDAPEHTKLHVITLISYTGSYWIEPQIHKAAADAGKKIELERWSLEQHKFENLKSQRSNSDVLWPSTIPDDPAVDEYVTFLEGRGYPPVLRKPGKTGASGLFKDDAQKLLLEEQFLIQGCRIRQSQTNLPMYHRPLGYINLDTFGFGSMFVTFRNCPNHCPLALWIEHDGYPALFPRKNNEPPPGPSIYERLRR